MLERVLERRAVNIASAKGWSQVKIMRASRNGWPDRIYHKNGRTVYIEWKQPDGKLSEDQKRIIQELRAQLIPVYVCSDLDRFRAILDAFDVKP